MKEQRECRLGAGTKDNMDTKIAILQRMSAHERYAKIQESSRTQNAGMRKHEQKKEERTVAECRSLNGYSEKTGIMFLST